MKQCTLRIGLAAAVVGLVLSGQARADLTIDQQDTDLVADYYSAAGTLGAGGEYVAQSFTPTASSMNYVQISLVDDSHGTVYLQLFAGNAVSNPSSPGPVLGTSNSWTVSPVLVPGAPAGCFLDFSFPTPIVLTPGTQYILVVESTSVSDIINVGNTGLSNYGGGTGSNNSHPNLPGYSNLPDFYFQEG
jgi:hypothetical protein